MKQTPGVNVPYDPLKHHRRSIRLRDYDYSPAGAYFVTMCVQGRRRIFGEIIDGKMNTNRFGEIVVQCWNDIMNRYPNARTDAFVVMPDHVHERIIINENDTRLSQKEPSDESDGWQQHKTLRVSRFERRRFQSMPLLTRPLEKKNTGLYKQE